MAKPGPKPINGETLSPAERQRRTRERAAEKRECELLTLNQCIATLETAIRAMLATPRLPGAAREIGRVALEGKANDANK